MKKLILLLMLLFLNINLAYATNWQWVNSTDTYSKYVDLDSIKYDENNTYVQSAAIWAKLKRADTQVTEYVRLKIDFLNQTIEPLEGRYDNASNVTISTLDKNIQTKLPPIQGFNNLYSDYYYYLKGTIENSNALKVSLESPKNLLAVTAQEDKNGKVTLYYLDKLSIRRDGEVISGYVIRVGLAADNTPSDWAIQKLRVLVSEQKIQTPSEIWGVDSTNRLKMGYTDAQLISIAPDSLGEKMLVAMTRYCDENPKTTSIYNKGIPKAT